MGYTAQKINDTTQIPEDITFSRGAKDNIPFGVTLPSVTGTETGLDIDSVQIGCKNDGTALLVSPIGSSTFSKTVALT